MLVALLLLRAAGLDETQQGSAVRGVLFLLCVIQYKCYLQGIVLEEPSSVPVLFDWKSV